MKIPHIIFALLMMAFLLCYGRERNEVALKAERDTLSIQALGILKGNLIKVSCDVDLKGAICIIPENTTLVIQGGIIRNGILEGHDTKLSYKGTVFDNVTITGLWNVPVIRTSMFKRLDYDNSLKDVFALSNSSLKNKIIIEKGNYTITASSSGNRCLSIGSNTDVIVDGTISLKPNDLSGYAIFHVEGENISINGHGKIVGDKHTHTGKDGEWGMGVNIWNGKNISISGITIKDCWGDCIYIGGRSEDVSIEGCKLDNGRRQGISITGADGVYVKNCTISNISGTAPEYAIDVEPNENGVCDNIVIERVKVVGCKGGFAVYGKAKGAKVGNVTIRKSSSSGDGKPAVSIIGCDNAILENCNVQQNNAQKVIDCLDVNNVIIKNNTIRLRQSIGYGMMVRFKNAIGRSELGPVSITNCKYSVVENNIEK